MRSSSRSATICIAALLVIGCSSKEPCDATIELAKTCNKMGNQSESDLRAKCSETFSRCNDDQKAQIADFYSCLARAKECNPNYASSKCLDGIPMSTITCMSEAKGCGGSPEPCSSSQIESECRAAGCTWAVTCSGFAQSCNILSSGTCAAQAGCSLSGTSCLGSAKPCSEISNRTQCEAQAYCSANTSCTGTPTASCNGGTEGACEAVRGCHWED